MTVTGQQAISDMSSLEESFLFLLVAGRLLDSGEWPMQAPCLVQSEHVEVLPRTTSHQSQTESAEAKEVSSGEQIIRR